MRQYKMAPTIHSEFGLGWGVVRSSLRSSEHWYDLGFFKDAEAAEEYIRRRIEEDARAEKHLKQPTRHFP